jgi:hypothetical protein
MALDKKRLAFALVIVLVMIGILISVIYTILPSGPYSESPKDWIEPTISGDLEISVEEATQGNGIADGLGAEYVDHELGIATSFSYDGVYNGTYFWGRHYFDENRNKLFSITENPDPNNGVPEGFIIETFADRKPVLTIFVDEDWKQEYPITNIVYGAELNMITSFVFEKETQGVYFMQLDDDRSRFNEDFSEYHGAVLVGTMTKQNMDAGVIDGVTAMRLS